MNNYIEKSREHLAKGMKASNLSNCCWTEQIMERFIKANLFIVCCVAAGLLLIVYLGAFSCEVSWLLEAHGNLPYSSYILCVEYFIVFIATTILIHGLVTGLSWGLFVWSIVIGLFSIPELIFVMIMTTQHWGLQSIHGLTELISYLIRLIINCFTLICVIPTGLRWRREAQVLTQLQDLATRLQLQTPSNICGPGGIVNGLKTDSRRASQRLDEKYLPIRSPTNALAMESEASAEAVAYDNAAYQMTLPNFKDALTTNQHYIDERQLTTMNLYGGSQNEFNASIFASERHHQHQQQQQQQQSSQNSNRTQSLMDLRCTLPGLYNPRYALENSDGKYFNITINDLKNHLHDSRKSTQMPIATATATATATPAVTSAAATVSASISASATASLKGDSGGKMDANDPIYCSIEASPATAISTATSMATSNSQNDLKRNHHEREPMPLPLSQYLRMEYPQQQQQQQQKSLKLLRNCVSLENLDGINKMQNEFMMLNYNQQDYNHQHQHQHHQQHQYQHHYHQQQQYFNFIMLNYLQQQQQHQQQHYNLNDTHSDNGDEGFDVTDSPIHCRQKCQSLSQSNLPNTLHDSPSSSHLYQTYGQLQQQSNSHLQQLQPHSYPHQYNEYHRRNSQPHPLQYYGGFGYANYTNPYITANSKLSLGNESDDYRKYRDVAL